MFPATITKFVPRFPRMNFIAYHRHIDEEFCVIQFVYCLVVVGEELHHPTLLELSDDLHFQFSARRVLSNLFPSSSDETFALLSEAITLVVHNISWHSNIEKAIKGISLILDITQYSRNDGGDAIDESLSSTSNGSRVDNVIATVAAHINTAYHQIRDRRKQSFRDTQGGTICGSSGNCKRSGSGNVVNSFGLNCVTPGNAVTNRGFFGIGSANKDVEAISGDEDANESSQPRSVHSVVVGDHHCGQIIVGVVILHGSWGNDLQIRGLWN
nr:hypothetical protein Iba_chr14eCG5920 [Ipomoea batatas]